jgi:hypothetical protein
VRVAEGPFYIYVEDPGFPDHPWPGFRRLGPFLTADEAVAQAVSDAAGGAGVAAGVYPESAFDALALGKKPAAHTTKSEIKKAGEREAKRRDKVTALELASEGERDQALQAFLPEGVTVADLREQGVIR